uniref:Uncharacterized protein n=1 Tax=Arundo donax TaxID=35708 RepID=A0A0A8YY48_ARUDO
MQTPSSISHLIKVMPTVTDTVSLNSDSAFEPENAPCFLRLPVNQRGAKEDKTSRRLTTIAKCPCIAMESISCTTSIE